MVCLYCPPSLHPHSSLLVAGVNQGMEGSIDSSASASLLTFFFVVILPHLIELWNIEPFRVSSLGRVFLASVYLSCRLLFLWSSRGICRRCLARSILCPPVFSDWEANREDISFSYNICVFSFLVHTFIASLYFVDFDAALQYLLHKDRSVSLETWYFHEIARMRCRIHGMFLSRWSCCLRFLQRVTERVIGAREGWFIQKHTTMSLCVTNGDGLTV